MGCSPSGIISTRVEVSSIKNGSNLNNFSAVESDDSTKRLQQKLIQLAGSKEGCLAQRLF